MMEFEHKEKPQKIECYHPPYSLRVKEAERHFGLKSNTLYNWINEGKLIRGKHYLKVGRAICIIREEFINFMKEADRLNNF